MGIWMRAEYSRFEPNHKSFIAGQKWKLIKWKVSSKCQKWSLRFWICRSPLSLFVGCLVVTAHHDFQLVPDGFSKITTAEHFLGAKRGWAAFKADRFFSSNPTLPAKQDGTTYLSRIILFGKKYLYQMDFFLISRWVFRARVIWGGKVFDEAPPNIFIGPRFPS